jgi:class 3 adenylate cyclase
VDISQTRYAQSGDIGIAYRIVGDGPFDVVWVDIRAGLHTGECEVLDGKVAGISIVVGARVATRAEAAKCSSRRP